MTQVHLTVLVHESWRDRYPTVVEDCRRVGMSIERELLSVGVIVGAIESALISDLRCVGGVSAVEPERIHKGYT